jgi:hypothetical protein
MNYILLYVVRLQDGVAQIVDFVFLLLSHLVVGSTILHGCGNPYGYHLKFFVGCSYIKQTVRIGGLKTKYKIVLKFRQTQLIL